MSSLPYGDLSREILDRARALAEVLKRDPAVERLRQARRTVQEREAARIMFRDLRVRQQNLLRRRAAGEAVSPEEWEEFRRVAEVVSYNPYVRELLEAEEAVAHLLAAVMAVLEEGLELPRLEEVDGERALEQAPPAASPPGPHEAGGEGTPTGAPQPYPVAGASGSAVAPSGGAAPPGSGGSGSPRLSVARSRLWVPGQPLPPQP